MATVEEVVAAGKRCRLTLRNLSDWAGAADERGREALLSFLELECASRDASVRRTLLRRCALPFHKTLGGYDWTAVSWPAGFGRGDLESLSFLEGNEALVLMGDVGTGNYAKSRIMSGAGASAQVAAPGGSLNPT